MYWFLALSWANLLAFAAQLGVIFKFPTPNEIGGPFELIVFNLLTPLVLFSQKAQFQVIYKSLKDEQNQDYFDDSPDSFFDFRQAWLAGPTLTWLLIIGNLFIVWQAVSSYHFYLNYFEKFQEVVTREYYTIITRPNQFAPFFLSLALFKGTLATFNIFTSLKILYDIPLRFLLWPAGAIVALVLIWLGLGHFSQWSESKRATDLWPEFQTVSLTDGATIHTCPPPGMIRSDDASPAVRKFMEKRQPAGRELVIVAVYAASQASVASALKNMEKDFCDFNCLSGLSWIYYYAPPISRQVDSEANLVVGNQSLFQRNNPAYHLESQGNEFFVLGDTNARTTDVEIFGQAVISNRLVRTMSHYGPPGRLEPKDWEKFLDIDQKWLEALIEKNSHRVSNR